MAGTLSAIYLIDKKGGITDVTDWGGKTPASVLPNKLIAKVSTTNNPNVTINLSLFLMLTSILDPTQTIEQIVTTSISDESAVGFAVPFPKKDTTTQRYLDRLNVLDANAASGYTVGYGRAATPDMFNNPYGWGMATDIGVQVPDDVIPANTFISINGYFHATEVVGQTVYALNAASNIKQCGYLDAVICDTTGLGGHTTVPITTNMLSYTDANLSRTCVIDVGTSLTGKTVFLVIDGILHALDGTYSAYSDTQISVNVTRLDLINCFLDNPHIRYKRDFYNALNKSSPLPPSTTDVTTDYDPYLGMFIDTNIVPSTLLQSNAFILSRLANINSFVLVIDTPVLYRNEYLLGNNGEPTLYEYTGDDMPRGLFHYHRGKIIPYTVLSSRTGEHNLYLKHYDSMADSQTTEKDLSVYVAPRYDTQIRKLIPNAKMLEFYRA